jgi:hypothetical protein
LAVALGREVGAEVATLDEVVSQPPRASAPIMIAAASEVIRMKAPLLSRVHDPSEMPDVVLNNR